jgi:hypothetical protein
MGLTNGLWSPLCGFARTHEAYCAHLEAADQLRGLLESDAPHGKLRLGVQQHALRFYFPSLWPEAEVQN